MHDAVKSVEINELSRYCYARILGRGGSMKRKVYWKDLFASFTHSKGRFLSILTLMLLGSLALVGFKGDYSKYAPNAKSVYFSNKKDARILLSAGDLGIDQADQEELLGVSVSRIWFTAGFDSERNRKGN